MHWVAPSICVLGFIFITISTQEENQLWQLSLRFLPHKKVSVNSDIGTEETRYRDFQEKREERRRRGTGNGVGRGKTEREEREGKERKRRVSRAE